MVALRGMPSHCRIAAGGACTSGILAAVAQADRRRVHEIALAATTKATPHHHGGHAAIAESHDDEYGYFDPLEDATLTTARRHLPDEK